MLSNFQLAGAVVSGLILLLSIPINNRRLNSVGIFASVFIVLYAFYDKISLIDLMLKVGNLIYPQSPLLASVLLIVSILVVYQVVSSSEKFKSYQ